MIDNSDTAEHGFTDGLNGKPYNPPDPTEYDFDAPGASFRAAYHDAYMAGSIQRVADVIYNLGHTLPPIRKAIESLSHSRSGSGNLDT